MTRSAESSIRKGSTRGAALGFRAHTGWAVLVALGGPLTSPTVLHRSRIELGDPHVPRFVYHEARDAPPSKAPQLVRRAKDVACAAATTAIRQVVEGLSSDGWQIVGGNVLTSTARLPAALEAILASHALIHAAEGELFRGALLEGCSAGHIRAGTVPERELWTHSENVLGLDPAALQDRLKAMGQVAGRPWGMDQKLAAVAAWMALRS
jgi:hypothetical protein